MRIDVSKARRAMGLPEIGVGEILPKEAEEDKSQRPAPMSLFGQLVTYTVGGAVILIVCFIAALITAFAGSGHNPPDWYLPFLAMTQALPILLFAISSCSLLYAMANNIRFETLSRTWIASIAIYALSFVAIFGLAELGAF